MLSVVHEDGRVLSEEYTEVGTVVDAMIDEQTYGRLAAVLGAEALSYVES